MKEPKGNRIIVYKGKKGWRWKAISRNGNNVANSGEDYGKDRKKAQKAAIKYGPWNYDTYIKDGNEYELVVIVSE